MTTATVRLNGRMVTERPDRRLEELANRVIDALLAGIGGKRDPGVARAVHDARRMRQSGDLDGALAAFADLDPADASETEARWAYGEWVQLGTAAVPGDAKRRRLQPGHGTGRGARYCGRRRRDAGGAGRAGHALGRPGAGSRGGACAGCARWREGRHDDGRPAGAEKASPAGRRRGGLGRAVARTGQGSSGDLPVPRGDGREFHGLRRLGTLVLLRMWRGRRRAGFRPARREPEPP